jgi:hypothetical protein
MDASEAGAVKEILLDIQSNDNNVRKDAESKLSAVKANSTDKYVAYMIEACKDSDLQAGARIMACVLLRGNMCPSDLSEKPIWEKISQETQEWSKEQILHLFEQEQDKTILNKIGELAAEVAVCINDSNRKDIWPDLFKLSKNMIAKGNEGQIVAALNVYTETFRSMCNEIVENDSDLYDMFRATLEHENLDIGLCSLQAISQLLGVVQPKYATKFLGLLESMVKIPVRALEADEETILEDAMIEFNTMAEAEPKFFKDNFGDLFNVFKSIITKTDLDNDNIRHQPVEFLTTVAERQPSLLTDNEQYLKDMLDAVFKLMIEIDPEIDDQWGDPRDPAQIKEEVDADTVVFGKEVIDRLCSSIGEGKRFHWVIFRYHAPTYLSTC